jgi:hypothetical protein
MVYALSRLFRSAPLPLRWLERRRALAPLLLRTVLLLLLFLGLL